MHNKYFFAYMVQITDSLFEKLPLGLIWWYVIYIMNKHPLVRKVKKTFFFLLSPILIKKSSTSICCRKKRKEIYINRLPHTLFIYYTWMFINIYLFSLCCFSFFCLFYDIGDTPLAFKSISFRLFFSGNFLIQSKRLRIYWVQNPAYKIHWISRRMCVIALMQNSWNFLKICWTICWKPWNW